MRYKHCCCYWKSILTMTAVKLQGGQHYVSWRHWLATFYPRLSRWCCFLHNGIRIRIFQPWHGLQIWLAMLMSKRINGFFDNDGSCFGSQLILYVGSPAGWFFEKSPESIFESSRLLILTNKRISVCYLKINVIKECYFPLIRTLL